MSQPSPDSESNLPFPWIGTFDEKKEIAPRERELFARAQRETESPNPNIEQSEWTTDDLLVLIRASRSDRLASRPVKAFAKTKLVALWSWDLSSVTSTPTPLGVGVAGAVDALMTARYGKLPQVQKRALYELMRGHPDLSALYDLGHDPPTDFFLSDRQFFRLFMAREVLLAEWRAFVTVPPAVLKGPCPSASPSASPTASPTESPTESESDSEYETGTGTCSGGRADGCSAARRRCARDWAEAVGEEMLSEENRYDPICALDVLRETVTKWADDGICAGCVESLRETCAQEKLGLWKTLGRWLEGAECSNEDEEAMAEMTNWSRVWPEWDSEDEVPVVQEKKRKVKKDDDGDGDGDVKVEEGEDPLLVKGLAANAKRRKKVKVEAASKHMVRSDGTGEASGLGTKMKKEGVASENGPASGEGQGRNKKKKQPRMR